MNREGAIAVLRKIMASCASFAFAQGVSLTQDKETKSWSLSVFWTPLRKENECLDRILLEYGLDVTTTDGRTLFHSL